MASTTNLNLTYLEIGQKDKSTTINSNFDIIDLLPKYLGEHATDPGTTNVSAGSTYYNTVSANLKVLKSDLTWVNA